MKKSFLSLVLSLSLLMSAGILPVHAETASKAPTVIPAIREWTPASGKFTLKSEMCIRLADADMLSEGKKKIIAEYFDGLFGLNVKFSDGDANDGDMILAKIKDRSLGKDGYTLEVTEKNIKIAANEEIGMLYGVITVLQSCLADGYVPCGSARDYSEYEIRSGMIDVARAWVPLDYVKEITKYFAWFKLNEIHLHVSDSIGGFRLESDIQGLAVENEHYTKDEYRAYQKEMLEYGIEVVTEIDTPAHSACFAGAVPEGYMLDSGHLDITKPEVLTLVKGLLDEYITGDDPVFVSKRVHIGTDEYPAGYNEQMRAYTDALIKHVRSRGYIPRFWGSFGGEGFNGETKVSSNAEANYWAVSLSDYNVLLNMGYDIINTCGPVLYIVPGGNYGFADYYNLESLYKNWQVNYLGTTSASAIDAHHPQLKGAGFALWNDLYQKMMGFSIYDIFDRLRGGVCLMSEKTWCGQQTADMSASDFVRRYNALSKYSGNSDPGHHKIAEIKGDIPDGTKAFGWPYTASMELEVPELGKEELLFSGNAGELYLAVDGSLGFRREMYDFKYDCRIKAGVKTVIELIADERKTLLRIDGKYVYAPKNTGNSEVTHSSTFVLPLEKVSDRVTNLNITAGKVNANSLLANRNLALGMPTSVSGLEVDDGRFTSDLAVDGDENTRLSFARDKDEQWLLIDLGSVQNVNKVEIQFFEHISDYGISVSADGESFTEVARVTTGDDRKKQLDVVEFDDIEARYIRYEQHKRFYIADWGAYYSGGISEIRVFGYREARYKELIKEAYELLKSCKDEGLRSAAAALDNYISSDRIYTSHIEALADALASEIERIKNPTEPETPDESKEEPEAPSEDTSSADKADESGIPVLPIAAAAAAVIALAGAIVFALKKKKK